jgi:hypothetical protein
MYNAQARAQPEKNRPQPPFVRPARSGERGLRTSRPCSAPPGAGRRPTSIPTRHAGLRMRRQRQRQRARATGRTRRRRQGAIRVSGTSPRHRRPAPGRAGPVVRAGGGPEGRDQAGGRRSRPGRRVGARSRCALVASPSGRGSAVAAQYGGA